MKKGITALLVLTWMFLIGSFSAQTGTESGGLSTQVAEKVVDLEEQVTGQEYTPKEREQKVQAMQFPLRKLAHMSEYAALALLLVWHLGCYQRLSQQGKLTVRLLLAWGIAVFYASTDELHQRFVSGRSGQLTDVCIDAAGAFAGLLLFWLAAKLVHRVQNNKKHQ